MKYIFSIFLSSLFILLSFTGCSEDELVKTDDYGYLQLELRSVQTRATVEGNTLEHLSDARKVKISLKYNGKIIEQTLNLISSSNTSADFSFTTENLKLQSGSYELTGYAIIGEYKSGDMAEILQVCEPDTRTVIVINEGQLTRQQLSVEAKTYGRFSAHLVRIEPEITKSSIPTYDQSLYAFSDIYNVQLVLEHHVGGISFREDRKVRAYATNSDKPMFNTDSIYLQTGHYTITHIELFNKRNQFMYAQDTEIAFDVENADITSTNVDVLQNPNDPAITEGIALKQIWDAMDGENWKWHEADGNAGANWVFKMSDGSPRPITAWTHQVGITLINGHVVSLNLGSFNPKGDVPDAIGKLTYLEKLYLGMHTDEVYYQLEGVDKNTYSLNPYLLGLLPNRPSRMEVARERTRIRQMAAADFSARTSRVEYKGKNEAQNVIGAMKYAQISTYGQNTSDPANRITGISPEIGKLRNLQELYIANTLIKKLPKEMQNLENVTDLEFYNNPFEEVDGEIFKKMQYLTSVNFDSFYKMSEDQIQDMLNKMCQYCPKIQLLYINRMNLTHLPEKLNYLTDLRLLDASFNKITKVKSLKPMAPIQFMMNYNQLQELPADFINTDDLELFSMTDNKLQQFPAVLSNMSGPYTISEIDLQGNQMYGFQDGFKGIRVEKLKLGFNCMGRRKTDTFKGKFPEEFSKYKSEINYFVLSGNNIDTITNAAVSDIKNVQAFDISVNNLRYLPSNFNSVHFPYLTGLEISHNRFNGFPNNVLNINSLGQLLCADQGYYRDENMKDEHGDPVWESQWVRTMKDWPEYLHQHGSLNNVDLSGNDFRNVTNFPTQLTTLNVTNNPNIRMRVPQWVIYKMQQGLYVLFCDEDQDIEAE